MLPNSPYTLIEALGSSQVGSVWSAVDTNGRPATIVVLDANVAADPRWREAFTAAATALAQPRAGGPRFLSGHFAASAPWVAFAGDDGSGAERVFLALGMDYQPVPTGADGPTSPAPSSPAPSSPAPGSPAPTSSAPTSPAAGGEAPTPPPVSGVPVSPAPAVPVPPDALPYYPPLQPLPASAPPPAPATGTATRGEPDTDAMPAATRRRGRRWLWMVVAVEVVLAVAGTALIIWRGLPGGGDPPAQAGPTSILTGAPVLTVAPLRPGIEPPRPGAWPEGWATFGADDPVETLTLPGLGFELTLPRTWNCILASSADRVVKYNCGSSVGDVEVGGEIIVRECASPCDAAQQTARRAMEEAWGLPWRFGGRDATIAETLTLNDDARYGLAVVAFWRSQSEGPLDRQVVVRMAGPEPYVDEIRRVVNAIRAQTGF